MKSLRALTASLAVLAFAYVPLPAQPGHVATDQVAGGRPAFSSVPKTVVALPDGGALVGGDFTNVNTSFIDYLVRIRADGSLDTSFNRQLNGPVTKLLRQPDGKILVGGAFTSAGGGAAVRLLRLNADLTLDTAFSTAAGGALTTGTVSELGIDSTGRVYVAIDNRPNNPDIIHRFAADGTPDASYDPTADNTVTALAVQADDKLLVGGDIVSLEGAHSFNLGRLNTNGSLDSSFVGASSVPNDLLILRDGRILLATSDTSSSLYQISATGGPAIANLNSGHPVYAATQGPGGQILVLGAGDSGPGRIYQLKGANPFPASASQDVDTAFDVGTGPDASVRAASYTEDGSIWIAGDFTSYDGFASGNVVKLQGSAILQQQTITFTDIADRTFDPAANTVTLSATTDATGPDLSPITFAVVSGPATLEGNVLTITGGGDVTVSATQAGNATYAPATVSQTFTVTANTPQTISFTQALPNRLASSPPVTLTATASSGLEVAFSVTGPASFGPDGKTLTLTGEAGTVTVTASQPGGELNGVTYAAATPVVRSFEVFLTAPSRTQKITFAQPAAVTYGAEPVTLSATASSELPVAFEIVSSSPSGIASLDGSTLAINGAGKVVIRATQPGDATFKPAAAVTRTLTVNKAPLTVKADDKSRLVGVANPEFTLSYTASDFVNGDTEADLASTRPVAKTKATTKSAQGDYAITVSGGSDANYTFVPANPPGELHVLGFGGTYEALLVDGEETPAGKLTLTVSGNAFSYTGTLALASEPKATSFKSGSATLLDPEDDGSSATGATSVTVTTANPDVTYHLAFTLNADGTLTGALTLPAAGETPAVTVGTLSGGARVAVFAKGESAPDAGANTLVLHPPAVLFEEDEGPIPGGSGHASAAIASTGVLTLKGNVADGRPLTASLKPTRVGEAPTAYLLWTNPYGTRTESFLAGRLALQSHPDQTRFPGRFYVPAEAGLLVWQKAPLPESTAASKRDKSYRAGFGPLGVQASLDPWLPPSTKAVKLNGVTIPAGTLAQRLGLADDTPPGVFTIAYGPESLDLGGSEDELPTEAILATSGKLTVTDASATSWTIKITPATGAFTGSFVLSDEVDSKTVDRKVTFSGTLRQAPSDDPTIGAGFFLLPGFAKTDEQLSGEIKFTAPVTTPAPTP